MKTLTYIITFFALLFIINACTKVNGLTTEQLVASSATVKTGQPDSLELVGAAATDSIRWSVSPLAGINNFYHSGKHGLINFNQAGIYTVTATVNNTTPYSTSITVTQAPALPVDTVTTASTRVPLTGDEIKLTANYSKSTGSDSAYVYFSAQTTKFYYCLNSFITYNTALNNTSGFTISFGDVIKPATKDCQAGSVRLSIASIPFKQSLQNKYLPAGTFPLTVTLNGVTYTGSVIVTATDVNINWSYTSGVTITPTHFSR
jgi:hypothetical protein